MEVLLYNDRGSICLWIARNQKQDEREGGSYHHQSSNKQKEEQKTDLLFIFDVIAVAVRSIIINTSLKYRRDNKT